MNSNVLRDYTREIECPCGCGRTFNPPIYPNNKKFKMTFYELACFNRYRREHQFISDRKRLIAADLEIMKNQEKVGDKYGITKQRVGQIYFDVTGHHYKEVKSHSK